MQNCFIEKATSFTSYTMPLYHSHNYHEIYFLADGKRNFFIENNEYKLQQNDIFLAPSGTLHRTNGGTYTRYLVNFTPDYLNQYQINIIELLKQQIVPMTNEEASRVYYLLDTLLFIQNDNTKDNQKNKDFDFNICFSFLLYTLSNLKNFPNHKHITPKSYRPRTQKILKYIQEHFSENITLDFFCKMLFVSEAVLCSQFKKDTGMTIMNYLLNTRLKKSQSLLMYSNKKISQISDACGFSSPKYFNLIFKKTFNVSPSEFRKNNKISIDYSVEINI